MSLNRHKRQWEELAHLDPLWSILSEPGRQYGEWEISEFFRTGEEWIDRVMEEISPLGHPERRERALDFGCGVGRLTRALSRHFDRCDGVDISEEMVKRARELNGEIPNLTFHVNTEPNLRLFPDDTFDLVYSHIVLQHVPSRRVIRDYIAEFLRVLRPGGLSVFQVPVHIPVHNRLQPRRRLYALMRALGVSERFLYRRLGLDPICMNFIPERDALSLLEGRGGRVILVSRGTVDGHPSCTFHVTK